MADGIDLHIDASKVEKALTALPDKIAKQYVRKAAQEAANIILASMKELAPERTDEPTPDESSLPPGILKEDLQTQVTFSQKTGSTIAKVGPTAVAAHVARWIENGWILTSHHGKKIKHIPGKHFMAAAADESSQKAIDAFIASLEQSLQLNTDDESGDTLDGESTGIDVPDEETL